LLSVAWSIEIVIKDGNMSENPIQRPLVADINSEWSWGQGHLRRPQPGAGLVKSPACSPISNYRKSGAKRHTSFRRPPPGGIEHVRAPSDGEWLRPPGIHGGVEADEHVRPLRHSKEPPALTRYVSLQPVS
jgi:hypothetical protein